MRWVVRLGLLLLLVGLLPMISALGAGGVAAALGCTLHEGTANTCPVAGLDIGDTLYTMFVLGWLALVTLPVAAAGAVVLAIAGLIRLVRRA